MKKYITILFAIIFLAGGWAPQAGAALHAVGPVTAPATVPDWYQDTQGLQLTDCRDNNGFCGVVDLVAGGEGFYWMAEAFLPAPLNARLILALEITRPNIVFTRIRIRFDAPTAGDYTVTHPFGKITLTGLPVGDTGTQFTQDIGLVAGNFNLPLADGAVGGVVNADGRSIGPFLIPADAPFVNVGGNIYIADPAISHTVTGSPLGTNFFRIEGPGLPAGGVTSDLFNLTGKVANCTAPAVNAAPVAAPELFAVAVGQPLTVNVIANDTDDVDVAVPPIGGGFGINLATIAITPSANPLGTAVANLDGTVTYTANPGASGVDTFTYTVQDYCMVPSNAVVENVIVEGLVAGRSEFRPKTGKWTITGESSLVTVPAVPPDLAGGPNVITLRKGSITGPVVGTAEVQADGTWKFVGPSKIPPGASPENIHVESSATVKTIKPLQMK